MKLTQRERRNTERSEVLNESRKKKLRNSNNIYIRRRAELSLCKGSKLIRSLFWNLRLLIKIFYTKRKQETIFGTDFFDTSLGTCRKISKILEIVCSIRNFDKWYEEKMEFVVGRKNDVNWINDDEFWHKNKTLPGQDTIIDFNRTRM